MNELRVLLAFVFAPVVTPLVFFVSAVIRTGRLDLRTWPAFVLVGYFAYAAAITFGIPAFLLYRKLRLTNPFWFLIGGALIGVIVFMLLSIWLGWGSVKFPVVDVLAATLSAAIFRLITGRAPYGETVAGSK